MKMKFLRQMLFLGAIVSLAPLLYLLTHNEKLSKPSNLPLGDLQILKYTIKKSYDLQFFNNSDIVVKQKVHPTIYPGNISKLNYHADLNTFDVIHALDLLPEEWREDLERPDVKHHLNKIIPLKFQEQAKTNKKLKIIAIAHSHNDPGWLKTVDDYFNDQTRAILDHMLKKLPSYPKMTFVWAETIFLSMWWETLTEAEKVTTKKLVESKQLEIVGGGWVVPDEACTHFYSLIDQLIEGHQWLVQNLGVKPRRNWSLDVFGYSGTLPYLYRKANMSEMLILRVHSQVKNILQNFKLLDFKWRQPWDKSSDTEVDTVMLPYRLYSIKHQCGPDEETCLHYDFRRIFGEPHEVANKPVHSKNIRKMAETLLDQLRQKNNLYRHNVVLLPIGDDFRYNFEIEWDQQYENFQELFDYMSAEPSWNVEAKFGTLEEYFSLVNEQLKKDHIGYPVIEGDFFPYMDVSDNYWTGYYTSRPFNKKRSVELAILLRAMEICYSLAQGVLHNSNTWSILFKNDDISYIRRALALFQHHDAITGTSRHYTQTDYSQRLLRSYNLANKVLGKSLGLLLASRHGLSPNIDLRPFVDSNFETLYPVDRVLNTSQNLLLFNSLPHEHEFVIRVLVSSSKVAVLDDNLMPVLCQVNPVWHSAENDIKINNDIYELIFLVVLPPIASKTFQVNFVSDAALLKNTVVARLGVSNLEVKSIALNGIFNLLAPRGEVYTFDNDFLRTRFSVRSGTLLSITSKYPLLTRKLSVDYLTYKSRYSGAYVFFPTGPGVDSEMFSEPPIIVTKGPVVSEIKVFQRKSTVIHSTRLYNSSHDLGRLLEVKNVVNMQSLNDKELVMKVSTDINSKGIFWSDSNGLVANRRQRFRNLPLSANYYPMTSYAFIEDSAARLSILSAQPLGVSSQDDGSLEVMLDRRPMFDDNKGLGEGITDNPLSTPSLFYIIVETNNNTSYNYSSKSKLYKVKDKHHIDTTAHSDFNSSLTYGYLSLSASLLLEKLYYHPHMFITNTTSVPRTMVLLTSTLPCDIQLINFRSIIDKGSQSASLSLHRVDYNRAFYSDVTGCTTLTSAVNLKTLWRNVTISKITEMSLSLLDVLGENLKETTIDIPPMDIRTFIIDWQH